MTSLESQYAVAQGTITAIPVLPRAIVPNLCGDHLSVRLLLYCLALASLRLAGSSANRGWLSGFGSDATLYFSQGGADKVIFPPSATADARANF